MADRYEDRPSGDPYTTGRGYSRHDRGLLERAGDEVRSWFGHDEAERRRRMDEHERDRYSERSATERYAARSPIESGYESAPARRYGGDRERYRSGGEYGWTPDRQSPRDWTPERWEREARATWDDRDDRFFTPADYQDWSRQGGGWTQGRPAQSRGFYEDDRGRVYQFEHGKDSFAGKGPKGYRRSDDRIREDLCDRLTDDGRVDASDVEVFVAEGEVTLSGTVNSRAEKRRAEDLAEEIHGVRDVHNNLRVNASR